MRRMDRYKDEEVKLQSRTDKNQELYQNVSNNVVYTNITDVTNANAFEINPTQINDPKKATRESYQQMRKYQNIEPTPRVKKELEDFNYLYQGKENKVYDINSVIEEARKNKTDDGLEERRKLKDAAYNILSGINKEELEKYREEKRKRVLTPEEEEIRELIDTIASKTLAGELDKETTVDLLSDLMATNMNDKVVEKQEEEKKEEKPEEKTETQKVVPEETKENTKTEKDSDFYTRSMDLSDKDFDMSNDFKEKQLPLWVKLVLFFLIVVVLSLAGFYIYQRLV